VGSYMLPGCHHVPSNPSNVPPVSVTPTGFIRSVNYGAGADVVDRQNQRSGPRCSMDPRMIRLGHSRKWNIYGASARGHPRNIR